MRKELPILRQFRNRQERPGDNQTNCLQITDLGVEEGCPIEPPPDFEKLLEKGAKQAASARQKVSSTTSLPPPQLQNAACASEEQKRFSVCVQPLTAFQPHPLAVIRQPKQIDAACEAYRNFSECRRTVACHPLWAQGMAAMFEFACGTAYETYLEVTTLTCSH
jgi:hypothetical protein